MTVTTTQAPTAGPTADDYATLALTVEALQESLVDAQLAADDAGWATLGAPDTLLSRDSLRKAARLAQVMAVADPLIRRAVNLRTAYVWGGGVTIQAKQEEGAEQDVNAVVQAFLDDETNQATFTSGQAHTELERRLATDGNHFDCFPTDPATGRVMVRSIPVDEIVDVVTNPEDQVDRWFYKRTYVASVVRPGVDPGTTVTARESRTVYYPALGYWPRLRPDFIDGFRVQWDTPVLHTFVNRPERSLFGIGDLHAALPWARGYREFLEDWARLGKALSQFAFKATAKGRNAATVRSRLAAAPEGTVGATVVTAEGQAFEAIGKSGATIDSGSARPLGAMVASATDLPVTMLLADPGITGARATAETLDKPTELIMGMRRDLHSARFRAILGYVIGQAVKAPRGPLRGTRLVDQVTGRETMILAGGQEVSLEVAWPDLSTVDVAVLMAALVAADGTGLVPPLVMLRMILVALGADNVDEVLASVTDETTGEFVAPADTAAAASAMAAVARGDLPGTPAPAPPAPAPPAGA